MAIYDLDEAREKLTVLVQRAKDGETVLISRDGLPIARLVPYEAPRSLAKLIAAMPQAPTDENDLFGGLGIMPREVQF